MGGAAVGRLMPNRRLDAAELAIANEILAELRQRLDAESGGDAELRFALNRKIGKELGYDERSKPMQRRALKATKRTTQAGLCAICVKPLPPSYCVLDRFVAATGYTADNTRLICESCDRAVQRERRFA